ncbi:MAG: hypothetical protein EHM35_12585 [Planctomycetaceae bacterium]|nr:MAG: hypothetical protein EHM35_12585 [Planctomycetaceae bacterium]
MSWPTAFPRPQTLSLTASSAQFAVQPHSTTQPGAQQEIVPLLKLIGFAAFGLPAGWGPAGRQMRSPG